MSSLINHSAILVHARTSSCSADGSLLEVRSQLEEDNLFSEPIPFTFEILFFAARFGLPVNLINSGKQLLCLGLEAICATVSGLQSISGLLKVVKAHTSVDLLDVARTGLKNTSLACIHALGL